MQRREKKITAAIASENSPSAIRAVRARSKPNDPDPRARIAKPRHGFAPVIPFDIRAAFLARHFLAILAQPVATVAGYHSLVQLTKRHRIYDLLPLYE